MYILKLLANRKEQHRLKGKILKMEHELPHDAKHPTVFYSAYLRGNAKAVEQLAPYFDENIATQNRKIGLASIYLSAACVLVSYFFSLSASGTALMYDRFMMMFAGIFMVYSTYKTYCYFNSKCFWELFFDLSEHASKVNYNELYDKSVKAFGEENLGECNEALKKYLK